MRDLPWFTGFRPHQAAAIDQTLDAYNRGAQVVILMAPTGAGKSIIAEGVRQRLLVNQGTYVATSKDLQNQFARDFPYARVLMGRNNYSTQHGGKEVTCADCPGFEQCGWCDTEQSCPYIWAREEAAMSDVAVLNTAYLLTMRHKVFDRNLMVLDEADLLEHALVSFYEIRVSRHQIDRLGLYAPPKGSWQNTVTYWINHDLIPRLENQNEFLMEDITSRKGDVSWEIKRRQANIRLIRQLKDVVSDWGQDSPWVRAYPKNGDFVLRPVIVRRQGAELVWKRGDRLFTRFLAMSGTILDPQQYARDTGIVEAGLRYETVEVPYTWPLAHRPIIAANFPGRMSQAASAEEKQKVLDRIVAICKAHAGDNIVIHTVSYDLTLQVTQALEGAIDRKVWTYTSAGLRGGTLGQFREQGGIIVAPSLDRGIDLPDDLCRVVIVAKVPFPSLGDQRVSARMKLEGGQLWYAQQTAQTLIQMTGRGIRHEQDRCAIYIVDGSFGPHYGKWSRLYPRWWRNSITNELPQDWSA